MPRVHFDFEWDDGKDAINTEKHGLAFDEAAYVLADPWGHVHHFNMIDTRHDEERYVTLASHPLDRSIVYVIVWTPRDRSGRIITRVISARYATDASIGVSSAATGRPLVRMVDRSA